MDEWFWSTGAKIMTSENRSTRRIGPIAT